MDGALASVLLFFLYCEHSSLINLSANQHLIVWVFTGLVATNIVNYYDLFPTPTASVLVVRHKFDFLSCNNLWVLNLIAILSVWIISDYRNMSSRGGRAGGRGDKSTGKSDQGRAKGISTLSSSSVALDCRATVHYSALKECLYLLFMTGAPKARNSDAFALVHFSDLCNNFFLDTLDRNDGLAGSGLGALD